MKGKTGKPAAKKAPVKKMKGGGLSNLLTTFSPLAMVMKGGGSGNGLLGAINAARDAAQGQGRSPDQVRASLGLKGGGLARKGVGVALKDGGKVKKKMAFGGVAGKPVAPTTAAVNPAGKTLPMQAKAYGLRRTAAPVAAPVVAKKSGGKIKGKK